MVKKKQEPRIPDVGQIVQVTLLDSGATHEKDGDCDPDTIELAKATIVGEVISTVRDRIVLKQCQDTFGNYTTYTVAKNCIIEWNELKNGAKRGKKK